MSFLSRSQRAMQAWSSAVVLDAFRSIASLSATASEILVSAHRYGAEKPAISSSVA
jgi:hypothetical protein